MRLEFYRVANEPNPTGQPLISWRLVTSKNGRVLLRSVERWISLPAARYETGLLLQELFKNTFEVYDCTEEPKRVKARCL